MEYRSIYFISMMLSIIMLSFSFYLVDKFSPAQKPKVEVVEVTIYTDTCMHGVVENIEYRSIRMK